MGKKESGGLSCAMGLSCRLLLIILLGACLSCAAAAPLLAESEITSQAEIAFADGRKAGRLTDGKTSTKYTLKAEDRIRIRVAEAEVPESEAGPKGPEASGTDAFPVREKAAEPTGLYRADKAASCGDSSVQIAGLYLIWDRPPGPWQLLCRRDDQEFIVNGGENDYLHEYVDLPRGAQEVLLQSPGEGTTLCELHVFALDGNPGQLPAWVQLWQPPWEEADLLLLPTHADDEHLFFGGTMPYYAGELGMRVQVAYLTHHWAEPYRPHELLNGLWTVGIKAYPIIGPFQDYFADSLRQAQRTYKEEEILAFQVELLRRFRPLVVIGHDINGEYGHGVHMLNAYTLQKALELSNDPQAYPESARRYGLWDVPKTYLHLWPENPILLEWDQPLTRFGGRTGYEMAIEGFACHVSQQNYFSVRKRGVHDCRAFGLYRSDRGPDLNGDDFMEGLTPRPREGEGFAASFVLPERRQRDYLERYGTAGLGNYFTAPQGAAAERRRR